ncbi:hypothetical protein AX15_000770 [Amanita polypyramis BW_CC]|nr:hypothetical protein AX15_000770 [Amanita polypyramis BW_CC]
MANTMPDALIILIILLMIEITILFSRHLRQSRTTATSVTTIFSSKRVRALANDLTVKIERVQDDFIDLECRVSLHRVHEEETEIARVIDSMYDTFVGPRSRLAIWEPFPFRNRRKRRRRFSSLCNGYRLDALDTTRMSDAFTSFCERLLAMNRIWKQEKQVKKLQSDVSSAEASRCGSAFSAFCDKLLLQNKVWRLEKQVMDLELESARLKRRFGATVKRAAKKMIEDLQYDRLIEGYVKDMVAELNSYKLALGVQSALREHELKEITWEWYQGYWKLSHEVEKLNLARQANSVQQDLQNNFEDSVYDNLRAAQRKVEELEARLERSERELVNVAEEDDVTEVDHESVSTSSFTCVSFGDRGNNSKRKTVPKPGRLILGDHTGFSFNPLFYGPNVSPLALMARHRPSNKGRGAWGIKGSVRTNGEEVRWRV